MAHIYDGGKARELADTIISKYVPEFQIMENAVDDRYREVYLFMEVSSLIINQIIVCIFAVVILIAKKVINKKWASKDNGKDAFCHYIVMWLYANCSLEDINIRETMHIIDNVYGCKVEELFNNNLSNELFCYLFTHKSGLKHTEEIKVAKIINEKRAELDSLPVHKVYSPVKKYVHDNGIWFCGLYIVCFLGYLPSLLFFYNSSDDFDLILFKLLVIHFAIIFALTVGVDVMIWRMYNSKYIGHGFVIRFLEKLYNKNEKVKSFFDFHTKS